MPIHRREFNPNAQGALKGIRVLDLSRLVAGNTLTMVLADLGAEVVKVETPTGDSLRAWLREGIPTHWKNLGRNKKSLGIDLRQPRGTELFKRLVKEASVLAENFRPGTLEKMGLAPDVLLEINPKLVITRISGWGQFGPYRNRPGFGTLIEGICGLAAANGFPDREPVLPPGPIADTVAGYAGAFSTLAALWNVKVNGGRGQVVDQPLFTPLFISQGPQAANYRLNGEIRKRDSNSAFYTVPRGLFKTKDNQWVSMSASMEPMPQRVIEAVGKGEFNSNPDYNTVKGRIKHRDEIMGWIRDFMLTMNQKEAVEYFESREVTVAPIYDISQIIEDSHFHEMEAIVDLPDDDMGTIAMFGFINKLSGTPQEFYRPAPKIGEHNREIVSWIGLPEDEIIPLEQTGVLHTGRA